ncbi:MAG: hypothetical protein K8T10_08080 [Candidatus Eremiobacteraeota bacterium]|nr:hypothetical protein [Candidatus Eremiobacteraeota bacterium]
MGLVVNKNIGAMTAHRYLKLNDAQFSKSVERLSSGLKINRAADDPAGLVISEKLRAQVEGLNQAIKNAQDGISLMQTAEGSLEEVTTVLRNMRNLALHAANTGASDSAAVLADQEQIEQAIATLDRIANTTAFGSRNLLNGSAGVTATTTDSDVTFVSGTADTKAGTYAVEVTTASVKGVHQSLAREGVDKVTLTSAAAGLVLADANLVLTGKVFNDETITVGLLTGDTMTEAATKINTALTTAGFSDMTAVGTNGVGGTVAITINRLGGDHDDAVAATDNGTFDADGVRAAQGTVTSSTRLSQNEIVTFKDGDGANVSVALTAGTTIGTAVSQMNTALEEAGFEITAAWDSANEQFEMTNNDYGASDVVTYSVASSIIDGANDVAATGIGESAGTDNTIADGLNGTAGVNVAGEIDGEAATSSDGVYLTGAGGTDVEGLKLRTTGGAAVEAQGNVLVEQNSLTFQLGAFKGQTVKMALGDMRANQLGKTATGTYTSQGLADGAYVRNLDVTTADGAQDAIELIDAALSEVSSMRSQMGSFQKDVLEASVRNLGVASQNMAASESAIRDADMAEVMLDFSRAQILTNTGMAMLAQANQAPQNVMRLFS